MFMWLFLLCAISVVFGEPSAFEDIDHPIINTPSGQLQGERLECGLLCHYYSFKGIPYAQPPVGNLRFRAPVPHPGWQGVRQASEHGNVCPQFSTGTVIGDEDCLFLNVYTQDLIGSRPVMVWIHGGSFTDGSGNTDWYGPEYLVQDGILLVTINYRLGILGFLSTGDNAAQGNYGLKDTVEALRWVRNNIAAFGGDPDNVTIFGESSGAGSVHFLVLSAMANGLFKGAIIQSGAAINAWALQPNPYDRAVSLANRLGIPTTSSDALVTALRGLPFSTIIPQTPGLPEPTGFRPAEFTLVVEPENSLEPRFMTATPFEILTSGSYNQVPLMFGFNDAENLERINDPPLDDSNPDNLVPTMWNVPQGSADSVSIANAFRQFYWNGGPLTNENRLEFTEYSTDHQFVYGIDMSVRLHAQQPNPNVFYYMFSYVGELNGFKILLGLLGYPGAVHGDELFYLFQFEGFPVPAPTSHAIVVRQRMVRMWTNFAKYSNPTANLDDVVGVQWPAVTTTQQFMEIGTNLVSGSQPKPARLNLWNNLANTYANL